MTDEDSVMTTYIFSAWQRIAVLMKEKLNPYLQKIIPGLFKMIKKIISEDDEDIGLGIV